MKSNTPNPEFEQLVRTRLQQLGDLAPTEVRDLADIDLVPDAARKVPRRRIAAISGAAVALAGGLTLTGIAATGGEEGGGNTPEDAVLEFVEAIENSDLVGALDVIDPGESEVLINTLTAVVDESARVGVFSETVDARDVPGATAGIEGLLLSTDQVATDLAVVTTDAGTAQLSIDLTALPLGLDLAEQIDTDDFGPLEVVDFAVDPLRIATVERDGQWYVSFSYSIAEAARRDSGMPFPVDATVAGDGFDDPGAAATAFWKHAASLDVGEAISVFAPGEADAIGRYLPLWLPGLNESIADARQSGLTINVSDLRFDITEIGNRSRVEPLAYVVEGSLPPSSDPEFPAFDPAAPTLVYVADGTGFHIIEAGDPIPESFDGLEPTQEFPDDLMSENAGPNSATLNPDGTIQQFWTDDDAVEDDPTAQDFRIEYADGCSITSGAIAENALLYSPLSAGVEDLGDGRYRSCDTDTAGSSLSVFGLLAFGRGGVFAPVVPSLETVEIDGRWYVSPIGTIGVQILDIFADVEDGKILSLDSPLAAFLYGVDRSTIERQLVGRAESELGPECSTIVEVDTNGTVTDVSNTPGLDDVRGCTESDAFWNFFGSDVAIEAIEPADGELIEFGVPESTIVISD